MPTIGSLLPFAAEFPASGMPQLTLVNRRPALAYDAANMELAYWTLPVPSGLTTPVSVNITYAMASATTGGIALGVTVEAITDGDTLDTDTANSFDANNVVSVAAVPGTAGYIDQVLIPLTNNDGMAYADLVRIGLFRVVADAADTASGDLQVYAVELRSN
jgi:asparagine N-glycosylation enzyme membrane subunit Stt3